MLDHGADPNAPDTRGSALHALAWLRRPGWPLSGAPRIPNGNVDSLDLVKKLLAHGADPNVRVAWKELKRGGFDLGMVVNNPPNINVGRNYITLVGATPFYLAAKHSDVELMRVLAAHGANPTIPTVQGVTPFMAAAGHRILAGREPRTEQRRAGKRHARSREARMGAGRQAGRQRHCGTSIMSTSKATASRCCTGCR